MGTGGKRNKSQTSSSLGKKSEGFQFTRVSGIRSRLSGLRPD